MMPSATIKRWARRPGRSILAVLAIYVIGLVAMCVIMCQPPQRFGQIMAYVPMPAMTIIPFEPMWNVARGGPTRVGEMAPDYTLPTTKCARDAPPVGV